MQAAAKAPPAVPAQRKARREYGKTGMLLGSSMIDAKAAYGDGSTDESVKN